MFEPAPPPPPRDPGDYQPPLDLLSGLRDPLDDQAPAWLRSLGATIVLVAILGLIVGWFVAADELPGAYRAIWVGITFFGIVWWGVHSILNSKNDYTEQGW